jgi:hypothetical protein
MLLYRSGQDELNRSVGLRTLRPCLRAASAPQMRDKIVQRNQEFSRDKPYGAEVTQGLEDDGRHGIV